ncbi:MAG: hypothetical protein AAF561_06830 [Planctomycetota bacterium]
MATPSHRDDLFIRLTETMRSIKSAAGAVRQVATSIVGGEVDQLARLYGHAIDYRGPDRNPVILIPGILGSKLEQRGTGRSIWGAFTGDYVDPRVPADARLASHPMGLGTPLSAMADDVVPVGVLDKFKFALAGLPVATSAYVDIIRTLSAGGYSEESCGHIADNEDGSSSIDREPGLANDAFQFAWDWRRDLSESAVKLHDFIQRRRDHLRACRVKRGIDDGGPIRFDLVAHSMGGMLARYYLMYGPDRVPDDGPLPPPSWKGLEEIGRLVIVGTPSSGSVHSLEELVTGKNVSPTLPFYEPAVLGTMPGIYQLLPRPKLARILDEHDQGVDLYDVEAWERFGWSLLDEGQASVLESLLPDADASERRRIARDHLAKILQRVRRVHEALDQHVEMPRNSDGRRPSTHLIAGDLKETTCVLRVDSEGKLSSGGTSPGDGVVTRASALGDERIALPLEDRPLRLQSPVAWDSVTFLPADHMGLTRHPIFVDNLLHLLLEAPRG